MAKRTYIELIKDNGKGSKFALTKNNEVIVKNFSINSSTKVPEHSTVTGFINDSYIKQPKEISIDIEITNEDLIFSPFSKQKAKDTAKNKYLDFFEGLLFEPDPVALYLGGVTYDNLHLESYSFSEDADLNLEFSLVFKEVFFASTKKTKSKKVPNNNTKKQQAGGSANNKTQSSGNNNGGNTGKTTGSKECGKGEQKSKKETKKSILKSLTDFLGLTK
jgi:hypothetical protein